MAAAMRPFSTEQSVAQCNCGCYGGIYAVTTQWYICFDKSASKSEVWYLDTLAFIDFVFFLHHGEGLNPGVLWGLQLMSPSCLPVSLQADPRAGDPPWLLLLLGLWTTQCWDRSLSPWQVSQMSVCPSPCLSSFHNKWVCSYVEVSFKTNDKLLLLLANNFVLSHTRQ